jgi:hypothetical protein
LVGFDELGNTEHFTTEKLAERISLKGVIEYEPELDEKEKAKFKSDGHKPSIYSSNRSKVISEMFGKEDDAWLNSDDEGDAGKAKDGKTNSDKSGVDAASTTTVPAGKENVAAV